ncbi:hypothetical protein A5677_05885 [Mycobacterium malmoense]|uniref:Uncharacterized protein n=1 Tax=Mycobacterium malmoense TaxID=1780 RepID=A0A1B9CQP1_MYCMA|nr:hypothetical protein A5677_05885 [Mycobacterium malmoense]
MVAVPPVRPVPSVPPDPAARRTVPRGAAVQRQPGVDATQVKHVRDEPTGAAGIGEQQAGPAILGVRVLLGGAVGELFGGDLNPRDRGAQLVGGVDEEAPGRRLGAPGRVGGFLRAAFGSLQRVQHPVESRCGTA